MPNISQKEFEQLVILRHILESLFVFEIVKLNKSKIEKILYYVNDLNSKGSEVLADMLYDNSTPYGIKLLLQDIVTLINE